MKHKWQVIVAVVLASVLVAFGLGGVLLFDTTLSTAPTPQRPLFPPFEMTREITTEAGTSVYQLSYQDDYNWKYTLVSSPHPETVTGADFYKEVRGGQHITSMRGHKFTSKEDANWPSVPGPWFVDEPWFTGHGNLPGNTLTSQQLGPEKVVAITRDGERTEIRYHVETGIPISYVRSVDGQVVVRHTVTALTVRGSGQIYPSPR